MIAHHAVEDSRGFVGDGMVVPRVWARQRGLYQMQAANAFPSAIRQGFVMRLNASAKVSL